MDGLNSSLQARLFEEALAPTASVNLGFDDDINEPLSLGSASHEFLGHLKCFIGSAGLIALR